MRRQVRYSALGKPRSVTLHFAAQQREAEVLDESASGLDLPRVLDAGGLSIGQAVVVKEGRRKFDGKVLRIEALPDGGTLVGVQLGIAPTEPGKGASTIMKSLRVLSLAALVAVFLARSASGRFGSYVEVSYPPSTEAGELVFGVTYTLWIPDGVTDLRGIIVHQHGCGSGACKGGATAAHDLHWQALARKWDCALLGPSYHQDDKQNCRLWCDPRNGSDKAFLAALHDLAAKSKHPELEEVPWCLWGHSGGGFWASLMQTLHPDRIVAIWFRSGTAFTSWEKGEITKPEISDSMYQIPMMCNPGAKENGDKRFNGAWTGSLAMFKAYRAKERPIGFAPDPHRPHECGDSRYLAIPFFDACLALRLPEKGGKDQKLKPVDLKQAWLAEVLSDKAVPAEAYKGKAEEAVWLPNERVAKAWDEYVKTGDVSDDTPPPAPFSVKASAKGDEGVEITWDADADFESSLQAFLIQLVDGKRPRSRCRKSRWGSSAGRCSSRCPTTTRRWRRCRKCASWTRRRRPARSMSIGSSR